MSTPQQIVKEAIENNKVIVFGKSYCREYPTALHKFLLRHVITFCINTCSLLQKGKGFIKLP